MASKRSVQFDEDNYIYIQKMRSKVIEAGDEYTFTRAVNDLIRQAITSRKEGGY